VRGSQESGSSGRYLNTWPVVISNTPRTAVVADILHFLPPLGLGPQDIRCISTLNPPPPPPPFSLPDALFRAMGWQVGGHLGLSISLPHSGISILHGEDRGPGLIGEYFGVDFKRRWPSGGNSRPGRFTDAEI